MPFQKPLPDWRATGIEPPLSLKTNGWQVEDKPPAEYFNWLQFTAYQALQELQSYALHSEQKDAANGLAPLGSDRKVPLANLQNATQAIRGIVQLNDTTNSTSTDQAATANAVKKANDNANTRIPTSQKAQANGVATLGSDGKLPPTQIPDSTPTSNGGMSAADKTKLNGIESGAQVNTVNTVNSKTGDVVLGPSDVGAETPAGAQEKVDAHADRTDNPHSVTKAQVGLGSVDNVQQATKAEFNSHTANKSNPHGVTKAQVGLGSVDNVQQAAKSDFDAHTANKSNPHAVTKSQVGLGNVDNVQQATKSEFNTHVNARNNPHGVTTEQINTLPNYTKALADGPDTYPKGVSVVFVRAEEGWPSYGTVTTFMGYSNGGANYQIYTPYADNFGGEAVLYRLGKYMGTNVASTWSEWFQFETTEGSQAKVDAHVNRKDNPHSVTKSQIGLGNVDNIQQATKAEFNSHTGNKNNPHGVTKLQVGLGSVDNVQQATKAEFNSHVGNKSNPHGVTTEQVNVISALSASTGAEMYPVGITVFSIDTGDLGYPSAYGTIYTFRISVYRTAQYFSDKNSGNTFVRTSIDSGSWNEWQQLENTTGSQQKANAVQSWAQAHGLGTAVKQVDWNTVDETGFYYGSANSPTGTGVFFGFHVRHGSAYAYQNVSRNGRNYMRTQENGTWGEWEEIESTAGAQSKANAVLSQIQGVGIAADSPNSVDNLNTLTTQGNYYFKGSTIGSPRDAGGVVLHLPSTTTSSGQYAVQIAILDGSRTMFLRNMVAGVWQNWLQIAGNMQEGWQNLTPRGGSQAYNSDTNPQVMRDGDTVFVRGALKGITGNDFLALTLPGFARPAKDWNFVQNTSVKNGLAHTARWAIHTSGDMVMERNSSGIYESGDWYPVHVSFTVGG